MAFVDLKVLVEHVDDVLYPKDCTQRLVLTHEAEANEAVPLGKIDGRRRIFRLDANDRRLYFGRWLEAVL